MIGDDAVGGAVSGHVGGDVTLFGVDKAGDHITAGVELGDGVQVVLVEKAAFEGAVDFSADAALLPVEDVVDDGAIFAENARICPVRD